MKTLADLIAEHPLFAGLPRGVCDYVAGCGRNRVVAAGAYVFREGDAADEFLLLRHGHVALETYSPVRGGFRFQTLGPSEMLGVSWLVPPYQWDFDARALETVRAIAFDARCLRDKCDEDPALGYALMKRFVPILVQRMQAARLQAMDVYAPS